MIYISSSNVKKQSIAESVTELARCGYRSIELSGGTSYYETLIDDLLELKAKYNLTYRLHNYFPPPQKHFVLNLAASNLLVREQSIKLVNKALKLSRKFDAVAYGIHAGFRIIPQVEELGKKINTQNILPESEAMSFFEQCWKQVEAVSTECGVDLYLENNVISKQNYEQFGERDPFFLTSSRGHDCLKEKINYKLLLDVGHLKVSANSLGLYFAEEMQALIVDSDYLHISDNDGKADLNNELKRDSELFELLSSFNLSGKSMTLEIYDGLDAVERSYRLVEELL